MYWSGDRLWEGCGECVEKWRREWGATLRTFLYSIHLKSYKTSANVFLGSYSLTLMKQPNTVASYGSRGRAGQGCAYVSLSDGFCSRVV